MHLNARLPTTIVPLGRHNHIIMRARLESRFFPRLEVFTNCHNAFTALVLPYTENLPKRRCSFDRRFVDAHLGTHRVNTSIRCQVSNYFPLGGCRGLMVWVVVLNNVVLNQRICRPAIDSEVRVAIRFKGTSPIYRP